MKLFENVQMKIRNSIKISSHPTKCDLNDTIENYFLNYYFSLLPTA